MKKNNSLVIILNCILMFLPLIGCSSFGKTDGSQYKNVSGNLLYKRITKINSEYINNNHGYIVLNFKSIMNNYWFCTLSVNGNKYFYHSLFFSNEPKKSKSTDDLIEYKIAVPTGKISIFYELNSSDRINEYTTNIGFFGFLKDGKTLDLIVEDDKIYKLNIIQLKKDIVGIGWASGGGCVIPFPKVYQEVAFEVEEVNDKNTEDVNLE